jgi:hypothetical protein
MAKATAVFTRGLRGKLGNLLVFKQVGNQTIVSAAPAAPKVWSKAQQITRQRFKAASMYAKAQLCDEAFKTAYALHVSGHPTHTAYHAALADYLNAPQITHLFCDAGKVHVWATDDFKVKAVVVHVQNNDVVLETNNAMQQPNGLEWTCSFEHKLQQGDLIKVEVYDIPGNCCFGELLI